MCASKKKLVYTLKCLVLCCIQIKNPFKLICKTFCLISLDVKQTSLKRMFKNLDYFKDLKTHIYLNLFNKNLKNTVLHFTLYTSIKDVVSL